MKPFTLLIKPASADCNLNCSYCFYLEKKSVYPESRIHRMSDAVLEKMISSYLQTKQPQYSFGWQGGEPTLMGIEFFKKAVELQQKYGHPGTVVGNGLQTNAVLIDDDMAAHFAKYNYLLGVSLDGPPEIHDLYRKNHAGAGSHAEVMKAIEVLKKHKVEFNILVLVSRSNVGKAKEVYKYLLENEFLFHQYIPCVEFDSSGKPLEWSITGREWGEFMCDIFDSWHASDTRKVSIRLFDSILWYLVEGQRNICHLGRNCCQYFVVEYNGDVYPCDFFVDPKLKLGNIMENSWEELQDSVKYKEFGALKSKWNSECEKCPCFELCSADCLKHRLPQSQNNPRTISCLCEGWKMFYTHSMKKFKKLAEQIKKDRAAQGQQTGR
ncbi:MAG TPA: anaerobic sulfatase maturase [Lentisphaeria bacterium]|nr:MAG: anaerobic sulfatase maturase [Lentisphaerae bacterium GWF2_49_21]HBC87779.1 anaerobic sulfatase maturase [Lentisphaeria bacterium]